MPINFKGHNIADLYKTVGKLTFLKKGEFETTDAFNKRKTETATKAKESIDYGNLKMGDYVVFPFNSKRSSHTFTSNQYDRSITLKYNADEQSLNIAFDDFILCSHFFFFVPLQSGNLGIYSTYSPEIKKYSVLKSASIKDIPPQYAEKNINDLTICCLGRISLLNVDYFEEKTSQRGFFLSEVQFWAYNVKTGEILAKFIDSDFTKQTSRSLGDTSLEASDEFAQMKRNQSGKEESETQSSGPASSNKTTALKTIEETWENVQTGRKQLPPQSWEKKQPSLIVDSETKNLTEALKNAPQGSVVQIAKGTRINLGPFSIGKNNVATLAKAIAIVGETGKPNDATIVVASQDYLAIQSSNVFFKGITFEAGTDAGSKTPQPIVSVEESGDALFIDCVFKGYRSLDTVGVSIDEGNAKFWNCVFQDFGEVGIVAQNEGSATTAYCEFSYSRFGEKVLSKGTIDASACFYSKNVTGFSAQEGGGGRLSSSLFNANENAWIISAGSSRAVKLDKQSIIVRK